MQPPVYSIASPLSIGFPDVGKRLRETVMKQEIEMEDKLQVQIDKFVAWKEHPCTVLSRHFNSVIMSTPVDVYGGTVPAIISVREWEAMPPYYSIEVYAFNSDWHPYRMENTKIDSVDKVFDKIKRHFSRRDKDAKQAIENSRRQKVATERVANFRDEVKKSGIHYGLAVAEKYHTWGWNPDEDPTDEAYQVTFKIVASRRHGCMNVDECKFVVDLVNSAVRLGKFAMPEGVTLELVQW